MLTEKQLSERHLGIGGSDVSAIMGLSGYQDKFDVYLQKIGLGEPVDSNSAMEWGNLLEPVLIKQYERTMEVEVTQPAETFVHPEYSWMRANVDGLIVGKNAILECKTTSSYQFAHWQKERYNLTPWPYYLQVAHYCAVLNADYADIVVLVGGNDLKLFRYERHMEVEKTLIQKEKEFWENHVMTETPPVYGEDSILSFLPQATELDFFVRKKLIESESGKKYLIDLKKQMVEMERLKKRIKQTQSKISDLGMDWKSEKASIRSCIKEENSTFISG
jgi:putative phage-type endonuclease